MRVTDIFGKFITYDRENYIGRNVWHIVAKDERGDTYVFLSQSETKNYTIGQTLIGSLPIGGWID